MAKKSCYMSGFIMFPTVINGVGKYRTRNGDIVTLHTVSDRHDFNCRGLYSDGTPEGWHKSGRIFASTETVNDIVERVVE